MIEKLKSWGGVIALAAIILLVGIGFSRGDVTLRGTTNYDTVDVSDGYQVDAVDVIDGTGNLKIGGSSATSIDRVNTGTCYIQAYAATIAATTSATVECQGTAFVRTTDNAFTSALTGVAIGDNVVMTL